MKVIILTALLFWGVAANAQKCGATFRDAAKNNFNGDNLGKNHSNTLAAGGAIIDHDLLMSLIRNKSNETSPICYFIKPLCKYP